MTDQKTTNKVFETNADTLDHIWHNWNCQSNKHSHVFETYYTDVIRNSQKAKQFEDWLYDQGAFVIQQNHKRFIRFHSEEDAIMFMLRWG